MQREYKKHGFFSFVPPDSRSRELWCLKHGESEINCVCRVLEVSRKEIRTTEDGGKVVLNGIIADHSAKITFVSWEEREELAMDTVVQIENAYVKKWKGLAALHIGKDASVIEKDIDFPGRAELMKPKQRTIEEIVGCEGAFDVMVEGDIVSVSRNEEKNKRVLDDGTGAVVLELREKEKEADILFGTPVKARGNVVESEIGYVLIAEKVKIKGGEFMIKEMKNFLCQYT
ncbi:MAG: hypothetical protein WBC40_10240 [Halobacteriota archaeon]